METYIKKDDLFKFLSEQQERLFTLSTLVSDHDLSESYVARSYECSVLIKQLNCIL